MSSLLNRLELNDNYTKRPANLFEFNKLLIQDKLKSKDKISVKTPKKSEMKKKNLDNFGRNTSDSFYGSYFTIYKQLQDNKTSIFNPMQSGYFGAFINENKINSEANLKEICGIPRIMSRRSEEDVILKENIDKYLKNYTEDELAYNNIQNEQQKVNEIERKLNTPNKKEKSLFTLSKINSESSKLKQFENIKSIPDKFLDEINKESYHQYLLEETVFLNPFKIINYEFSLQENFKNLIYKIDQPVDLKEIYSLLIYLIQGIPSELFSFNFRKIEIPIENEEVEYKFIPTFILLNQNFRFLASLQKVSQNFLEAFINFGTKMHLIQILIEHYLYNNDKTPFIIRKFYSQINLILIKLNEEILGIKEDLMSGRIGLIGLHNRTEEFSIVINMIYEIMNIPDAILKFSEFFAQTSKTDCGNDNKNEVEIIPTIHNFLSYYEESGMNLKSHKLLNSLFNCFHSFNHPKSKNYKIIKNLLLLTVKSYLNFILYLIFNNELIDQSNEYFIIRSNDSNSNICIDNSKVPSFLQDFKNILINNTILLNLIKKYDIDYFSVCNYKINEILYYIEKFDMMTNQQGQLETFLDFKDRIFNKKVELMFAVNENIFTQMQLVVNESHIKRLNHLKTLREFMSLKDEYELERKKADIERKRKLLEESRNDIIFKKTKVEENMKRIKDEKLEEIMRQQEEENMRKEIIEKLKEKYDKVISDTKLIEGLQTADKFKIWKVYREKNKNQRFELFNQMFDFEGIEDIYPKFVTRNLYPNLTINYHLKDRLFNVIEANTIIVHENQNEEEKLESDLIPVNPVDITISSINLNVNNEVSSLHIIEDFHNEERVNNSITHNNTNTIDQFIIPEISQNLSTMNINNDNQIVMNELNIPQILTDPVPILNPDPFITLKKAEEYPKFFIKNIILNDILNPIIEAATEIAMIKNEKRLSSSYTPYKSLIKRHTLQNKQVDSEVNELLNKMQVLISERMDLVKDHNGNEFQIEIPIQVILQEFFYDLIIKQYKVVNNCFVLLAKNKLNLLSHFDFLRQIYLCNSGDIILNIIDTVIDFKTLSLKSNEPEYLYETLRNQIHKKYALSNDKFCQQIQYFQFSKVNNLSLKYSITNLEMAFKLLYKVPEPLHFVLSSTKLLEAYDSIFKFFFKFYTFQHITSKVISVFKNQRKNTDKTFMRTYKILFKSLNFLKSFQIYLFHEVLDKSYKEMIKKIEQSLDIFEIIDLHQNFLNKLLSTLNNKILILVNKLHIKFAKFFLKTIAGDSDYLDYQTLKDDMTFLKLVDKIERINIDLSTMIREEQVIGEFYNLKFYL